MHGIDGYEHRWIADRRRRHAADRGLRMAVMVHIRIVEHDLAAPAQRAAPVGFALDEAVDQPAVEVLGARTRRQLEPSISDRLIDTVEIERIPHQRVPDTIAPARTRLVAE